VLDLSLADVGPARRLGWDREVDAVAGQLGEDVRLEPVDEPAAQLDLGARELAGECPAAQTAQAIRLLPQLPAPARRRLTSFGRRSHSDAEPGEAARPEYPVSRPCRRKAGL
jgi:hypothetical protein